LRKHLPFDLCDRTRIKPEYRGHKLGLLIKAMSISALGRGCGVAVTYPALFEGGYDHAEDSRASRRSAPIGPSLASSTSGAAYGCWTWAREPSGPDGRSGEIAPLK
jgi:hypothetical protein